jgi:hypothetical protein
MRKLKQLLCYHVWREQQINNMNYSNWIQADIRTKKGFEKYEIVITNIECCKCGIVNPLKLKDYD